MSVDRRSHRRIAGDRRAFERVPLYLELNWHSEEGGRRQRALLVDVCDNGLAMLVSPEQTPGIGQRIVPQLRGRRWLRHPEVVRIEPVSETMNLVASEYSEWRCEDGKTTEEIVGSAQWSAPSC